MQAMRTAWLLTLVASSVCAQTIYSDAQLLSEGDQAYQRLDCARASRFLFAYQQRNPTQLQRDAALQGAVATALEACIARVAGGSGAGTDAKFDAGGAPKAAPKPLPKVALSARGAAVDRRCDIYASIAVAQQRANSAQSCNQTGPMWNERYAYHYDWCLGAPEADRRSGTAARQFALDRCKP